MTTARIDWLTFRSQASPEVVAGTLQDVFGQVQNVRLVPKNHGSKGFDEVGAIHLGGMVVGQYATGGVSQRGWSSFSVTGSGCEWVKDWGEAVECLEGVDYEVRRADLAVDTYRGEATHAKVVAGHEAGAFTMSGRPPKLKRIESWPREDGWTAYVGQREQGKFFRGYEKGYEQAGKYGAALGLAIQSIDGHPIADWYRCEVELKAKDRALPEDLLLRRDEYFAGAYPFCRQLIDVEPFQLKACRERRPQLEMLRVLALIKHQWGRTLYTAQHAHGGDLSAVWDLVCGTEHSQSLLEAGVLLVEHS